MADTVPAGIALAVAAAASFEAGYLLQALEARRSRAADRGLLAALARRRRWLAGLALTGAGAVLQVLALRLAPLVVVQPVLALGAVVLVCAGARAFHEPLAAADVVATLGLSAGVALIAVSGAGLDGGEVSFAGAAAVLAVLGAVMLAAVGRRGGGPALLVAGAGAGDALAALAAARFAGALDGAVPAALAWLALAASGVVASLSVEMRAVRRWPVTRVGPIVLVAQTALPVLLAPLVLGENWLSRAPGVLGGLALVVAGAWRLAASAGLFEDGEAVA